MKAAAMDEDDLAKLSHAELVELRSCSCEEVVA